MFLFLDKRGNCGRRTDGLQVNDHDHDHDHDHDNKHNYDLNDRVPWLEI